MHEETANQDSLKRGEGGSNKMERIHVKNSLPQAWINYFLADLWVTDQYLYLRSPYSNSCSTSRT